MKFSIRDLLLVTVIAALAVGWWVDRSRQAARLNKELEWRSSLIDMEGPLDVFTKARGSMFMEISGWNCCPTIQHPPQISLRNRHGRQLVPLPGQALTGQASSNPL
jgi:hypothetical protein